MRFAICNELFDGWAHQRVCQVVAELGYTGLEIAPYTFGVGIGLLTPTDRRIARSRADDQGLAVVGLHWLLAGTQGLALASTETQPA